MPQLQGNCSDSDAVEALHLTADVAAHLLPLKPRQCLLVVSQTWIMVNGGHLWIDNFYLKLSRHLVRPNFAFVTAGALNAEYHWPQVSRSITFMTNLTFQGEHRGNARGIITDVTASAVAVEGADTHPCLRLQPQARDLPCMAPLNSQSFDACLHCP